MDEWKWMSPVNENSGALALAHQLTRNEDKTISSHVIIMRLCATYNELEKFTFTCSSPWRLPQTEKKKDSTKVVVTMLGNGCSGGGGDHSRLDHQNINSSRVCTCSGDLWLRNADTLFLLDYFYLKIMRRTSTPSPSDQDHTFIRNSFSIRYTRTNAYI